MALPRFLNFLDALIGKQEGGMDYVILTQDEQDEMLVNTLEAQERDHWSHTINQERYEAILAMLPEEDPFHARVTKLHAETVSRLAEVNAVIAALKPQMPDNARIADARTRIRARG